MYGIFLIFLALVWISFATISDFRKREIPDWISYSLIVFALAYRAFVSVNAGWNFLLFGVLGFCIFFVVGNAMYRSGFGGGDAKLLMALGSILPFSFILYENFIILVLFLVLLLVIGAVYSFAYSIFLVLINFEKFKLSFRKEIKKYKNLLIILIGFFIISIGLSFYEQVFIILSLFLVVCPLLFVYAKSVDNFMIKTIPTRKLTIGDWLAKEVKIGKRIIKPKLTGLDKAEIILLRKYKKSIEVKDGVPFTISFLLAFLAIVWLWYSSRDLFNYNFWF